MKEEWLKNQLKTFFLLLSHALKKDPLRSHTSHKSYCQYLYSHIERFYNPSKQPILETLFNSLLSQEIKGRAIHKVKVIRNVLHSHL